MRNMNTAELDTIKVLYERDDSVRMFHRSLISYERCMEETQKISYEKLYERSIEEKRHRKSYERSMEHSH